MESNVNVDALLARRMHLQRYVTSLFNDVMSVNARNDEQLIQLLTQFVQDADEATLLALARGRTGNEQVRKLLASLRAIVKAQREATMQVVADQMPELVRQELEHTASALDAEPPSDFGVASRAIGGASVSAIISGLYQRYWERLSSDVSVTAGTDAQMIPARVRGTKSENFKNGIVWWRDNRLVRPNVDLIVNGTAANAAEHVYITERIEKLNHTATLDFRVCLVCAAHESGSPYRTGYQPRIPVHPSCRCLNTPYRPESPIPMRPHVMDVRRIKDIPLDEREGIGGVQRDTMDKWINRMSPAQRTEWMGPARAQLWASGKVTDIKGFVSELSGQPLRLDQLPKPTRSAHLQLVAK